MSTNTHIDIRIFVWVLVRDCQFGVSPVNYSDSDSDSNNIQIFDGEIDFFRLIPLITNIRKIISCIFKGGFYCKKTPTTKHNFLLYSKIMKLPKYCKVYVFMSLFIKFSAMGLHQDIRNGIIS